MSETVAHDPPVYALSVLIANARLSVTHVPAPSESRQTVAEPDAPLRGGSRREGERGRIGTDGAACQRYEGPLNAQAIRGIRLVESERRAEDPDYLEDMLYTAAIQVGWLPRDADGQAVVEVPDIEILIGVPGATAEARRRKPPSAPQSGGGRDWRACRSSIKAEAIGDVVLPHPG